MRSFASIAAAAVVTLPLTIAAPNKSYKPSDMDASYYKLENVINLDVVIIGGGSIGAYSAIQLKDQGKQIVVVESKARLGGHTETYMDAETGIPIGMGVKLYHDEPLVHQWSARFNLSTTPFSPVPPTPPQTVDFRTGQVFQGLPPANQTATAAALQRYAAVLAKYPQLEGGFYLPDPVSEDLYMPFGQFVQK
jgi:phytoene dehydrogenase-like protein